MKTPPALALLILLNFELGSASVGTFSGFGLLVSFYSLLEQRKLPAKIVVFVCLLVN